MSPSGPGVLSLFKSFLGSAFISPTFLWFLGLIPVIVLLYLLKLRRTEVVISSTLLWLKSLQDLTANAPFQRLRKNLLLLFQILVIIALAAALGRPFTRAEKTPGGNICLLVDRSASMQTIEADGRTRMEIAKVKALAMVDEMRGGDKMTLVTFARNPEVLTELSDDRVRLRRLISAIQATDEESRIRDAFFVAQSLRYRVPDLGVVVVSDGNIADLREIVPRAREGAAPLAEDAPEKTMGAYSMTFLQVGETSKNAGIVAFNMREPMDGQGERQTLALVHNSNSEPLETTLSLYFSDELVAVSEINIPPGEDGEAVFSHAALGEGLLRAELDVQDALDVDNRAWLAVRRAASLRVLLVAEPDASSTFFLRRVLALDPRVSLESTAPSDYVPTQDYDLTVFNCFAPEMLPGGSVLVFNAVPDIEGLHEDGVIENPPIIAADTEHPAMRFLSPSNVGVYKARRLILPTGARTLISTSGAPLAADVSRGGQQILLVAFDLMDSDWPLNLSFPLFIQNVLSWIPKASLASETYVAAGRSLTIPAHPLHESATVEMPSGEKETINLDPMRPVFFSNTHKVGPYKVSAGDDIELRAVNLLNRAESAITPAPGITIGRVEFEAERDKVKVNREYWRWLVLAGIAILCVEWWIYSRRAWL